VTIIDQNYFQENDKILGMLSTAKFIICLCSGLVYKRLKFTKLLFYLSFDVSVTLCLSLERRPDYMN
jgi:hypothetical protein